MINGAIGKRSKKTPKKRPKKKPKAAGAKPSRVLFVDDDEGCRMLVRDVLRYEGVEVVSESTVDAGLKRAAEEEYDLVILDLMLPSRTGGEAAFKIRELDDGVPILALSGYLDKWDADDLRALGFTSWMGKPFKTKDLVNRVRKLMAGK